MVEALVAVAVGALLMITMQSFFSHGIRSTMKGQDALESIRAASSLLTQFRKDLTVSTKVTCGGGSPGVGLQNLGIGTTFNPGGLTFGSVVEFTSTIGTITYSFSPAGRFISRQVASLTAPAAERRFAVPRLKEFGAALIIKEYSPFQTGPAFPMPQGQVLVRIKVTSEDPRFPAKEVAMSSFFTTSQLKASDWNYYINVP